MKARFMLLSAVAMIVAVIIIQSCNKSTDSQFSDTQSYNPKTVIEPPRSLTTIELLGKSIYFDKISNPVMTQGCFSCHAPEYGFGGADAPNIDGIYEGAVKGAFGNRMAPSAAYATFSPKFHFSADEGLFEGGLFWDGRATGHGFLNPAAEQAMGPFLNPVEQNTTKAAVLEHISKSTYAQLWQQVFNEPISYTEADIEKNYKRVGEVLASYEASPEVNQFSSKFDLFLKGAVQLTGKERQGMVLFNGKAKCNLCHISEAHGGAVLFTDFTYDNLGVPKKPNNPYYRVDPNWIDPGLGGFLMNTEWAAMAKENWGKHKVPTLRNVAKMEGKGKRYMHNGFFGTLKEVVHFYNTRDVENWPAPEVAETINTEELGDLKLSAQQEDAIVAFLRTLSDGYSYMK